MSSLWGTAVQTSKPGCGAEAPVSCFLADAGVTVFHGSLRLAPEPRAPGYPESKPLFEVGEGAFEFPLLASALVGGQKPGALGRRLGSPQDVADARRRRAKASPGVSPQASSGQEAVLQALAGRALQVRVGQPIALDGPQIFVRHVGAGNAFVVAGNRDRNAIPHVD